MGSAAEFTEPTIGTEKHHQQQPVEVEEEEEEDEQVFELERKTSSSPHAKRPDTGDSSTITTNNNSSSSSFDVIPDFRNTEEDHIIVDNLELPEEHDDGGNCNVHFDSEHGFESAIGEPDTQTVDLLNGEKNPSESEDNKGSNEIEEVQDADVPKEVDAVVVQPTGDVIEEEVDIEDVEDYDVEKVLDKQETHDLFCPNCNSCITKRVVLRKRKRKISHVPEDLKRVRASQQTDHPIQTEDSVLHADDGENYRRESFVFKCLSCFSIFIPAGVGSKPLPPSEAVEGLKTQPKPQEEITGNSNWLGSIFGFSKKGSAAHKGEATLSVPKDNIQHDNQNLLGVDTTGSIVNTPSEAPPPVQDGPAPSIQDGSKISASQDKESVDTPLIQVANSHDTGKIVNNGATVEDRKKFQVPPMEEEQTQGKIYKDDSSAAHGNHSSSEKGHLSPIQQPSHDMNISNTVTSGPDGIRVETIFHAEDSKTRNPDFGQTKVTGVIVTGDNGVITTLPSPEIDIPPAPGSSLEEGTVTESLLRPVIEGSVVEGRKVEILKSIVYGGLIESITSLGVISSAAGSGASMLNILVLGLANLFGGLILIIHNLQELREEEPRTTITMTEDNQTNIQVREGRYKRLLGRRENFALHASVAILSFIIAGLLPPVVYYFSFSKTHNKDYKVASVFGASLVLIVLLALGKAHVRNPRGSHLKSALYYTMIAVSVSGISYVVGNFLDQLLEKYGWSDGSETPAGQMMLSLMGRKAGSFGYSSSY